MLEWIRQCTNKSGFRSEGEVKNYRIPLNSWMNSWTLSFPPGTHDTISFVGQFWMEKTGDSSVRGIMTWRQNVLSDSIRWRFGTISMVTVELSVVYYLLLEPETGNRADCRHDIDRIILIGVFLTHSYEAHTRVLYILPASPCAVKDASCPWKTPNQPLGNNYRPINSPGIRRFIQND